jgi:hypothetical protein
MTEGERKAAHDAFEDASRGVTLSKIRALSDEDLVASYDALVRPSSYAFLTGPDDYLNELHRPERARETQRIDRQTTALIRLTYVLAVLTAGLFVLEVLRITGVVH